MKLDNIKVYDLEESIVASGYPMRTSAEMRSVEDNDLKRAMKLAEASNGNGAHGQYLTGIRVSFDLTCTNKMWVEAERYRFLEFVSSQSTMHRITKFNLRDQYNKYVDPRIINIMEEKVRDYNNHVCAWIPQDCETVERHEAERKEKYLEILYSNPAGFELTARMTTNYRCLLNIYIQRYNHRLPEWREFCEELLKLPYFKDIVEAYRKGKENKPE